jgi:hypothetical protein
MPGIIGNFKYCTTSFQKMHGRFRMNRFRFHVVAVLLAAAGCALGQDALSLSSGSVAAGQTISLDLSLTTPISGGPTALEWTYSYPAATFSSVIVVAGPAAVAAGKSVSCSGGAGSYTCMLFGLNNTLMTSGVVATATFTVSPSAASSLSTIQLLNSTGVTASDSLVSVTATGGQVTINSPYTTTGLTCSPATIMTPGSAECIITVSAPAPTGGLTVATGVASGSSITIPSSVAVPPGSNSASFTVSALTVNASATAVLAASLNASSQYFTLTLAPVTLTGFSCNPSTLPSHTLSTCTITFSDVAPGGGLSIAIKMMNPAALAIPALVSVPAGSTGAKFYIKTFSVKKNHLVTLQASVNGSSFTTVVTVEP